MQLNQAFAILERAHAMTGHTDFVIVGSLSALGLSEVAEIPDRLMFSNDLDCYTKSDPGRVFDLINDLGEGSMYEKEHGVYLDGVDPRLPTLPDGWQERLLKVARGPITAWFLEINDAAISKYARGEPRDTEWIRAGVETGLISLPTVGYRLRETTFLDDDERAAAISRYQADLAWFAEVADARSTRARPKP